MVRARGWIAGALAAALLLAACGSDDKSDSTKKTGATDKKQSAELTDSFRGVTAKAIKVGIVVIDYDCIKQFVDFTRGDQQKVAQVFVDDINANGGVLGRKIEPVYKTYCPIPPNTPTLKICTSLTEDQKVFAVLGVFIDFSGEAQLCLSRDHETIHIGHELKREWIDQAPPGLMLTPDITQERRIQVLMHLVKQEKFLKGKKVAILADQDTKKSTDDVIKPALEDLKVKQGSTAILNISGTDTSAAQGQLDSFIEKWKNEKVTALVLNGQTVSTKQFIEKIKGRLPNMQLLSSTTSDVHAAAQDEVTAGKKPNPYEGLVSADGEQASERWKHKSPQLQHCVDTFEKATGTKVIPPDELKPGADGKRVELYVAVEDFCGELYLLKLLAEKAGPDLTNDSWVDAVNHAGKVKLVTTQFASFNKGKYDADDAFRLLSFDSSIGTKGDWKNLTDLQDASKTS